MQHEANLLANRADPAKKEIKPEITARTGNQQIGTTPTKNKRNK
jgi:hypothetical protein